MDLILTGALAGLVFSLGSISKNRNERQRIAQAKSDRAAAYVPSVEELRKQAEHVEWMRKTRAIRASLEASLREHRK